jgi:hypothetical protein
MVDMEPKPNLKPCPFCPESVYPNINTFGSWASIVCPSCDITIEVQICDLLSYEERYGKVGEFSLDKLGGYRPEIQERAKDFLIKKWNTRARSDFEIKAKNIIQLLANRTLLLSNGENVPDKDMVYHLVRKAKELLKENNTRE